MTMLTLKSTDVRSRIEPELKADASEVLAECGLSLRDGIRLFLRQVVAERGLPFSVTAPNARTAVAMREARLIAKARFANAQDLINDLQKTRKPKAR